MGYYVSVVDGQFVIPADKTDAALAALKDLNGPRYDEYKVGGFSDADPLHFPWMDHDWADKVDHLADAVWLLGFEPENMLDGSVGVRLFSSKWREHIPLFLSVLAPFIPEGSYLTFSGEEAGDMWRYVIEGGAIVEYRAEIVWVRAGADIK